jgi:hypothetical protein
VPELGQKYQDRKDSLANRSADAALRVFQMDLKKGNDAAAQGDLERAQTIDPSSTALQFGRLDLAVHRHRANDIAVQARLIDAMEEGRLRMNGRTLDPHAPGRISLDDARTAVIAHLIAGKVLDDGGEDGPALQEYERASSIAQRVGVVEIAAPAKYKQVPLSSQPDLGPESRNVELRPLLCEAHRRCAEKFLARNNEAAALPHCQAMLRLHGGSNPDPVTEKIGYRIYRKLGWPSLGGLVPANWQSDFLAWDRRPN